jgi:hypothetical protein
MSQAEEAGLIAAAPEVGIPLEIGKELAPHAPTLLMIPLVIFSIICIIASIILLAAVKSKTPGALLLVLGLLLGSGAFLVVYKTESRKKRA